MSDGPAQPASTRASPSSAGQLGQEALDAAGAVHGQGVERGSAHEHRPRAESERRHRVEAAADAAVDVHLGPLPHRRHDLGQRPGGAHAAVELAPAVVGDVDGVGARVEAADRVVAAEHALDHDRDAGPLAEPGHVVGREVSLPRAVASRARRSWCATSRGRSRSSRRRRRRTWCPGYGVSAVSTTARAPCATASSSTGSICVARRSAGRPGATRVHRRGPRTRVPALEDTTWRQPAAAAPAAIARSPCGWTARCIAVGATPIGEANDSPSREVCRSASRHPAQHPGAEPHRLPLRGGLGGRQALPGSALDVGPDGRRHAAARLRRAGSRASAHPRMEAARASSQPTSTPAKLFLPRRRTSHDPPIRSLGSGSASGSSTRTLLR